MQGLIDNGSLKIGASIKWAESAVGEHEFKDAAMPPEKYWPRNTGPHIMRR
jgi:hypothetical protein